MSKTTFPDLSIPQNLAQKVAELADGKKSEDIYILNVKGLTVITDYFVICSVDTTVQAKAVYDSISDELKPLIKPWHAEGIENQQWILIDLFDVIVHIFIKEMREYYQIERLWSDAPMEVFDSAESE